MHVSSASSMRSKGLPRRWWILAAALALGKTHDTVGQVFQVVSMPKGREVTLSSSVLTQIPLATRVTLTATDSPQSLKLSSLHQGGGIPCSVQVAIFDRLSDRVRYVMIPPNGSLVYKFKGLSSIVVAPKGIGNGDVSKTLLQINSDKPLSVAH